eukprot:3125970-Rhodomonas_salina.1
MRMTWLYSLGLLPSINVIFVIAAADISTWSPCAPAPHLEVSGSYTTNGLLSFQGSPAKPGWRQDFWLYSSSGHVCAKAKNTTILEAPLAEVEGCLEDAGEPMTAGLKAYVARLARGQLPLDKGCFVDGSSTEYVLIQSKCLVIRVQQSAAAQSGLTARLPGHHTCDNCAVLNATMGVQLILDPPHWVGEQFGVKLRKLNPDAPGRIRFINITYTAVYEGNIEHEVPSMEIVRNGEVATTGEDVLLSEDKMELTMPAFYFGYN